MDDGDVLTERINKVKLLIAFVQMENNRTSL